MANTPTPTIGFRVPAVPVAQPRPRAFVVGGHARVHEEKRHPVTAFKATVRMAAEGAYDGPPINGPVALDLVFVLPRPAVKMWKTKAMPRYPHTSKPDLDNLVKAVKDALTGVLWRDDSQVAACLASKWVAAGDEQPHVVVELTLDDFAAIAAGEETP